MLAKAKLILFIFSWIIGSVVHAETSEFLTKDNRVYKIFKEIAKKKLSTGFNVFSWDQIDGLETSLGYRISVEPSYMNGFYTRVDRYEFENDIRPGAWFDDWSDSIGISINAGSEVLFARQFKSQGEALNIIQNPPYDIRNIPVSAKNAMAKLVVGDFVSLKGNLNLMLSAEAFTHSLSTVKISGVAYVMIMGQFNIHFYKLPNNKLRLKIIADRQKEYGAGIHSSKYSGFKALGIESAQKYIGGRLKQILNFKPIDIKWSKNSSDLVMVDYVFDLNNAEAAQAYNHFMSAKMKLKQLEVLNPLNNIKDLQEVAFSDLTQIEKIFWQDKDKPESLRRIDRVFQGRSYTSKEIRKFNIDLRLIDFDMGTYFSSSRNIITDRDNKEKYFLFDTKNPYKNIRFFWDFYGDDTAMQSNILFETDKTFEPNKFSAYNVTKRKVIRSLSKDDFKTVQKEVERVLPSEISNEIDWQNWNFSNGDLVNGYFTDEIFFKAETLGAIYTRNPNQIQTDLVSYLKKVGTPPTVPSVANEAPQNCQGIRAPIECYEQDIQVISYRLSEVLSPLLSPAEKRKALLALNENELFQQRGAGFLLYMIPAGIREDVVSYTLSFRAKGVKEIKFTYGNFEENNIYRGFLYILGVLNNRSYDLRLIVGDSQGYQPGIVNQIKY